jgi:branched-chain amino acid transport system ATP-binding protein
MMLDVQDIHGYYGKSHVLQGVSLAIGDGELVTLLGRNGAGKSTTLKAIAGIVPHAAGVCCFMARTLREWPRTGSRAKACASCRSTGASSSC